MACSQSFLLKNLTMVLSLCLFRRWHASILSPVMSAPIRLSTLQTVGSSSLVTLPPQHICREHWAFFQYCLFIDDICLDRISFIFLITKPCGSTFWKFSFKRLISAVSETIVVLVRSWVLKNKSVIWFLFNALSVFLGIYPSHNVNEIVTMTKNGS